MDLNTVFSSDVYKKRGLHAIAATQDDIKNAVLDMLEIGPDNVLIRNVMPKKLKNICIVNDSNVLFSKRSVGI